MSALSQLQNLLRDLFQLELADLNFGLYRLLHLKRHEIEAFMTEQLLRQVDAAFQGMAAEEEDTLQQEVSNLAAQIRQEVAEDALLPSGEISAEYHDTKIRAARELLDDDMEHGRPTPLPIMARKPTFTGLIKINTTLRPVKLFRTMLLPWMC